MKTQDKVDETIENTVVFVEENICSHLDPIQKAGLLKHLYLITSAQLTKDYADFLELKKKVLG